MRRGEGKRDMRRSLESRDESKARKEAEKRPRTDD